jgi:uncharacterized LabA/DUF88 family protein
MNPSTLIDSGQSPHGVPAPDTGAGHIYALVDYNNLPAAIRNKGFRYIADIIVDAAGEHLSSVRSLTLRLYDGWYRGTHTTRYANKVRLEIDRQQSFVAKQASGHSTRRFLVRIEQAFSVLDEPAKSVFHTFRPDRSAGGVRLQRGTDLGCRSPSCPLDIVAGFISERACPVSECTIRCDSLLSRNEQKLIDTMICVDLIHLAAGQYGLAVVLSSDDDLVPAIRYACRRDLFVLHIGTHAGRCLLPEYVDGLSNKYAYTTVSDA